MKKIVKKVRNLQIYLTTVCLLLTGCSLNVQNASESPKEIIMDEQNDNSILSNLFNFNMVPETNTSEHSSNSALSYDDMILTLEEKGIESLTEEARNAIQNVSFYNTNPYNLSWVEHFQIEDYYQAAYTHPNVVNPIKKHQNTQFYNRLSNSIYWDRLADYIMQNSKNRVDLSDEENLIALTASDINVIIKQLARFAEDVKKDYPNYDMEHLACQLGNLSLAYRVSDNANSNLLACTTYSSIEWFLNDDGEFPILQTSLMLNEHEFKHFLCSYCQDEITTGENVYITPSGVIYGNNTSLNFSFIEEATAEEYSAARNGHEEITYYEKVAALDTIKFVLSLQDNYEEDGFIKYSFLRKPLAIVQQFPVLNDQTYYFKNNIKMLASYNACFSALPSIFINSIKTVPGYEDFYNNQEQRKEILSSLGTYASAELSRIFLTNLVVMNDTKDTMTLDYNFYLMRLFEKRMDIMFSAMSDFQNLNMSSANYKQIYQERLGAFFQYLSIRYQLDLRTIREFYDGYSLDQNIVYPPFVEESKQNFYKELETKEYDEMNLKEKSEKELQYYVQYSTR